MAIALALMCAFTQANLGIQTKANGTYAFVVLYNAIYGFTWGPMPWLLPAGIGGYYYIIIAGFYLFSTGLVYFYYVETAHHTLEEIAIAFGDKAFAHDDEEILRETRMSLVEHAEHAGSRRPSAADLG